MSLLTKALQGGNPADALKPELLGSIRVAVVGEPSVGKTALTEVSTQAGSMVDGMRFNAVGSSDLVWTQ